MTQKRNCNETYWKHDWEKAGKRERCVRCGKLNPVGVAPETRFWDHVEKTKTCWLWKGNLSWNGYGLFMIDRRNGEKRKNWRAHRLAWFMRYGWLPMKDLDLHHRCNTRRCVRPGHLQPMTRKENLQARKRATRVD